MVDLSVKVGSGELANPVMPASGAFSTELEQVIDINRLGAMVAKTVSRNFRAGNPTPRVAEIEGGMINSIGVRQDAKAVDLLTTKLQDPDAEVASAAAVALGWAPITATGQAMPRTA